MIDLRMDYCKTLNLTSSHCHVLLFLNEENPLHLTNSVCTITIFINLARKLTFNKFFYNLLYLIFKNLVDAKFAKMKCTKIKSLTYFD